MKLQVLKTVGSWLAGSGWSNAIVEAQVATSETADSFLQVSHVTRTRYAHHVTASALYDLQQQAYLNYTSSDHE